MRRKAEKPKTRTEDNIEDAEVGDYCYYLSYSNKPVFAEIKKVFTENDILVFQLMDQVDYKFLSLPSHYCAFSERELKGKKRSELKNKYGV